MAEVIRMPLLSDTMKEGVIAAWHKNVGDAVRADDVLAEVETDKATMEVNPYVDGTLLYIGVEAGKAAQVNEIIAIIGKPGEDFQALLDKKEDSGSAAAETTAPAQEETGAGPEAQADEKAEAGGEKEESPADKPVAAPDPSLATVIRMPLLSDTMQEGKIVAWLKQEGDTVKADDVIAEVETDKATMELNPYVDGTLLHIGVQAGNAAKVNEIIAIVGKAGTDIRPYLDSPAGKAPASQAGKETKDADKQQAKKEEAPVSKTQDAAPEEVVSKDGGRIKISPLARKLAEEKGIDPAQIKGSGDQGRVIKRDVDAFRPEKAEAAVTAAAQPAATQASPAVNGAEEGYTDIPLSQMRKTIARRLSESKFQAPHFYLRMTITMDQAIEARKHINAISPVKVSFNDMIIRAAAAALRKHPEVNSSWTGEAIRQYNHVHIGTAVAVDEGLIVPVIRFADRLQLSEIAAEAGRLIDKARNKKLQPQEYTGNTFTISNLGMMDIDEFTAIINAPDSCILAVGKITATPVVENGAVVVRQLMKLTLSCDHRVVDGAVGARFMQTLKAFLENPVTILV